uniref:CoA transferase n=1 Tax=Janibacter limosus TaxID=53458 RepID=A0AC61U455_9MICO|nr:CoA transferase [Janibacter limosus]
MSTPMPLEGVTVVSIAINLPGPAAAARLTAQGARVVTVIPPGGDPLQQFAREYFEELHDGRELRTLDLKTQEGRAELDALLATADVFVTSSRPSALRRLDLNFASVHARHPQVCQIDIVGYPGERAEVPGHDLTYRASSGLLVTGSMPGTAMIDLSGAERAAAEASAALSARARPGEGIRREVALSDLAHTLSGPLRAGLTGPGQLLGGGLPVYAIHDTADGQIALAALESHFTHNLLSLLGLSAQECTHERLGAAFAERTAQEWAAVADEHDIPIVVVDSADG